MKSLIWGIFFKKEERKKETKLIKKRSDVWLAEVVGGRRWGPAWRWSKGTNFRLWDMWVLATQCTQHDQHGSHAVWCIWELSRESIPRVLVVSQKKPTLFSFLKNLFEMTDVNHIQCGNHFTVYVNQVILLYTWDLVPYVNYISVKVAKKKKP